MGEIINLVNSDDYEDFMFVAAGESGYRAVRIGSRDRDLRVGDLLLLNKYVEGDILECL